MIAITMTDQKDFINKLLVGEDFNAFWLVEASITTYNTFTIDGSLNREFFEKPMIEALERNNRTYSLWMEIKPYCHYIIRGKHKPLSFKIVFQLSRDNTERVLEGLDLRPADVGGLYLNVQYNGSVITCTTGTSLHIFSMDKTLDQIWDNMVLGFMRQHQLAFEQY